MDRLQPGQLRAVAGTLLPQILAADPAPGVDQRGDCRGAGDPGGLHHVTPDLPLGAANFPCSSVAALAGQPAAAKLWLAGDPRAWRNAQSGLDGPGSDQASDHVALQPERRADGAGANRLPAGRTANRQRHARSRPHLRRGGGHPRRQSLAGVPPGGAADEPAGHHHRRNAGVRLQRQQLRSAPVAGWSARADAGGDGP